MFNLVILREFDLLTAASHHQGTKKDKVNYEITNYKIQHCTRETISCICIPECYIKMIFL